MSSGGGRDRLQTSSAVRGAGLVGAAVVLGIILLQVIDDGPSSGDGGTTPGITTTTTGASTTTAPAARARNEVRIKVYNAGAAEGTARLESNNLVALGYQVDPPADTQSRTGSVVACKPGFEAEAEQLAVDVGPPDLGIEPFPSTPPEGSENVNCIVLLGQA